MPNLFPFESNLSSPLTLSGDLERTGSNLILTFELTDPAHNLELPPAFRAEGPQVKREDGLWNDTCFEMFLRPARSRTYYEFNFALTPAWNEYIFSDYRTPQPPEACADFSLQYIHWDGRNLKIELKGANAETMFDISLNAVLKEKSGVKHYMALAHKGAKADFHLAENFILKR